MADTMITTPAREGKSTWEVVRVSKLSSQQSTTNPGKLWIKFSCFETTMHCNEPNILGSLLVKQNSIKHSHHMTQFPPKKGRFEGNRYEGMQNEESRKIGKGN